MRVEDDSYYAVIFTAEMSDDTAGYADMAQRMTELVERQSGYIGKHTSMEGNRELTISYWESLAAIKAWKAHPEHRTAQEQGCSKWYADYQVQVTRIDRIDARL